MRNKGRVNNKSVSKVVLGGYDKLRDQMKVVHYEINYLQRTNAEAHTVEQTGAGNGSNITDAIDLVGSNLKAKIAGHALQFYNNGHGVKPVTLVFQPIKWANNNDDKGQREEMKGLRYFLKSWECDLSLSAVTHPAAGGKLAQTKPIPVWAALLKVRGNYQHILQSALAGDLFSLNNEPMTKDEPITLGATGGAATASQGGSVKILMSKRWHLSPGNPSIKCKFYKNMNVVVKSEIDNKLGHDDTIDRATEQYIFIIRHLPSIGAGTGTQNSRVCCQGIMRAVGYEM